MRAVIGSRSDEVREMLGSLEADGPSTVRLKALARRWAEMRDLVARYGCPFGTLTAELDRRDDGLDREAAEPLALILEWAEGEFRRLGRDDARDLAVSLLSGVQGAALLASAFRAPDLLADQVQLLEQWIDSLG